MWLYGRMSAQPGASGISQLKSVLAVCGLPEAIENKVLHFFEELNVDGDWRERSNEDWQARSQSLVALISEVQQHLRGISGLTTG